MRFAFVSIIAALLLAGCGGGGATSTSTASATPMKPDPRAITAAQAPAAAPASPASPAPAGGMPTPPAGAQWTIYCQTISGAGHVQRGNQVVEQLRAQTPLKDWYVVHGEGQSTLYYGFYRSFNEVGDKDTPRAQTDRKRIDSLSDQMGNRPFKFAFFVALDAPDPVAPPEWNLLNADGDLSLQIAAYTGGPLRKQYAIDAVRAFRAQGEEAYYYHGETTSSVCIGAFPSTSLQTNEVAANVDGNPEQTFLQSSEPLPDAFAQQLRDNESNRVRVVQSKAVVVDPKLRAAMERYPEHAINGEVKILEMTDAGTGKRVLKPADSFIVPIPKAPKSALSDPAIQGEPVRINVPREQPGVGRLRGIDQ